MVSLLHWRYNVVYLMYVSGQYVFPLEMHWRYTVVYCMYYIECCKTLISLHCPIQMKYCVSLCLSHAKHKLLCAVMPRSYRWTRYTVFTRLLGGGVGSQLIWHTNLLAGVPCLKQRNDSVWTGWILTRSQEYSSNLVTITSSAYPLWHVGTRNYTAWRNYW